MLLCEFTPDGGSLVRISLKDVALTHQWYGYIVSMASVKFQTEFEYGGYVKPSFSDIKLSPEMFVDDWPPPQTATVKLSYTDTTEAAAVDIFEGTAQRAEYDRYGIKYKLKMPEFDSVQLEGATNNNDLDGYAANICGATKLNLTLDTTYSRSPSPDIYYLVPQDIPHIDHFSSIVAWCGHAFVIIGTTLYLYDLLSTENIIALTEFDVLPCVYRDIEPINLITAGDESVAGSNLNGSTLDISPVYSNVPADIVTAITDIKTILEQEIAVVKAKFDGDQPKVLECMSLTDESTVGDTVTSGRVMSVIYNFDTLDMEMEVYGAIT